MFAFWETGTCCNCLNKSVAELENIHLGVKSGAKWPRQGDNAAGLHRRTQEICYMKMKKTVLKLVIVSSSL